MVGQPGRPWSLVHPTSLPAASEDLFSSARAPLPLSSFPQSLSTQTPRSQHLFYTSPLLPQSLCLRDQIQAPERGLRSSLPTQPRGTQHSFKPGPRSRECRLHALWANAPAAPASLPPTPFTGPAPALLSGCSNPDHRRYHPHLKPEHPRATTSASSLFWYPPWALSFIRPLTGTQGVPEHGASSERMKACPSIVINHSSWSRPFRHSAVGEHQNS